MLQNIRKATMKYIYTIIDSAHISFIQFMIVGCINTAVDFTTFIILHGVFDLDKLMSQAVAYSMGILNSFIMNKLWTFKAEQHHFSTINQLFLFVIVNMFSLSITLGGLSWLNDRLGINVYISKVVITIIAQVINYLGYKSLVFRKQMAEND